MAGEVPKIPNQSTQGFHEASQESKSTPQIKKSLMSSISSQSQLDPEQMVSAVRKEKKSDDKNPEKLGLSAPVEKMKEKTKETKNEPSLLLVCIKESQDERVRIMSEALTNGLAWATTFREYEERLDELMQDILSVKIAIKELEERLQGKYKNLELSFLDLVRLRGDDREFEKERILRSTFNRYKNQAELEFFIKSNMRTIINQFATESIKGHPDATFTFHLAPISNGEHEPGKGETHNGGQGPVEVIFTLNGEKVFSVMYKPRSAAVDNRIQQLLQALGETPIKILDFPDENKSIWEYIVGEDMVLSQDARVEFVKKNKCSEDASLSPEAYIEDKYAKQEKEREGLLKKLKHLNDIFLCIYVTDLHGYNVRITPNGEIFAIDLEVINKLQDTFLVKKKSKDDQTLVLMRDMALRRLQKELRKPEIKKLIESFNAEVGSSSLSFRLPVRYVVADTEFFRDMIKNVSEPDNIAQVLTTKIIESMVEEGVQHIADAEVIKKCIYKDLLNKDIPFFTEKEGVLYHGYVSRGVKIGARFAQ